MLLYTATAAAATGGETWCFAIAFNNGSGKRNELFNLNLLSNE